MGLHGVELISLQSTVDRRGSLTTLFVAENDTPLAQWNLVRSRPRTIRGIHVHAGYDEYYAPFGGRAFVHLHDARRDSPSFRGSLGFWVDDAEPVAIRVPAGVAHGLAFPDGGQLLYGLSEAWSGIDELGCRWDDPELAVAWPVEEPLLSDRDMAAGSYAAMVEALDAALMSLRA